MYIVKAEPISEEMLDGLKYTATHEAHNGYVFEFIVKISVDESEENPTDISGDFNLVSLTYNNEVVNHLDHKIDVHAVGTELTEGILRSIVEQLEKMVKEKLDK